MNESDVKQQIVDSIKNADTVLITVAKNSNVDELSAALGMTLYLNDIGKHATAVVSGEIPPAINFLKPEKTFENSVDSLRDFVIALDKEKADHLRYKVEGDVVKIFITPYRTIISQNDLKYSQGDYNVELVLAFGVKDQNQLDSALSAHGRILHDAAVATVGQQPSTLGTMDWSNAEASSLSEMAADLVEVLQSDAKPMTEQVASALLTGIVAATDRFSNDNTTSRVMTVAAQLMAKGANQQLIAAKLREGSKVALSEGKSSKPIGGTASDNTDKQSTSSKKKQKKRDDSRLAISHDKKEQKNLSQAEGESGAEQALTDSKEPESAQKTDSTPPKRVVEAPKDGEPYDPAAVLDAALKKSEEHRQEEAVRSEEELARQLEETVAATTAASSTAGVVPADLAAELAAEAEVEQQTQPSEAAPNLQSPAISEVRPSGPSASAPANDSRAPVTEEAEASRPILSHAPGQHVGDSKPVFDVPFNGAGINHEPPSIDPFKNIQTVANEDAPQAPASPQFTLETPPAQSPQPPSTLAQLDEQHRQEAAPIFTPPAAPIVNTPVTPAPPQMQTPGTPPPPPTPDFSQLPPLPQMPDFTQLPTPPAQEPTLQPEQPLGDLLPPPPQPEMPQTPPPPGQFKIPGQQ
jgi:hypothetical protein